MGFIDIKRNQKIISDVLLLLYVLINVTLCPCLTTAIFSNVDVVNMFLLL